MPAAAVALAVAADVLAAVRTVQTEGDGSGDGAKDAPKVGRCRLTVSKPALKAPPVSALDFILFILTNVH